MKKETFDPKKEIIKIIKFIYDRRLTFATGGNCVLRYKDKYYSTPTGLGRYYLFELSEEDIIVFDKDKNIIEKGRHKVSVAAKMHIEILDKFPEYSVSLHTHGEYSAVFASINKPIPEVTIPISYYGGGVPIIKFKKNFDILVKDLINKMTKIKKEREKKLSEKIQKYIGYEEINSIPTAVLIEREGLMIAAPDLRIGAVTAEAIEEAARCFIYSSIIHNHTLFKK